MLPCFVINATVADSPIARAAFNVLEAFPLKLTVKFAPKLTFWKYTAWVSTSYVNVVIYVVDTVAFSNTPNILDSPFNVILPRSPFGVNVIPTFVSPPVAEIAGLFPVAAFVTEISFTADAVVANLICSLPFSSPIKLPPSIKIFFAFVSKFAASVGVISFDNFHHSFLNLNIINWI